MKSIYYILTLILLCSSAIAQTNQKEIQYNINKESDPAPWKYNRVGVYGSFMSGYGLAYQRIFKNRFAIKTQIFGYAILDDEEPENDRAVLVWGADLQYSVMHTDDYRFYAMAGIYYNYFEEEIYSYNNFQYELKNEYTRDLNYGIGLGA